ncbi:hypothetical protein ABKN59_006011, partial [Abortiporus biennis]
ICSSRLQLTASYKKPNSQSILRNNAIPNYLRPMPFQKIRFLGGKLGRALAEVYDVSTVGDLLTISLDEIQRKFGEDSIWVYEILRGVDRSEVKEKPPVTKSMLASKNLPHPITKTSQGHHWIRVLAAELALRLREARESVPALWPKSVVLHVRQGYETSRSKQAPFPFTRDFSVDSIAAAGDKLWKELLGTDDRRSLPMKITSVQLSFSGIESMETGQRSIEGFFKPHSSDGRDTPHEPINLKRKREAVDENSIPDSNEAGPSSPPAVSSGDPSSAFICERCGKRIAVPKAIEGVSDDIKSEALATLRLEHEDFHFAQDLSKEDSKSDGPKRVIRLQPQSGPSNGSKSSGKKKKAKPREDDKAKGIARFFANKD